MKVRIVLYLFLLILLLSNTAVGENNANNVTIEFYQIWNFINERDATVTEIITTNEDWVIQGNIGIVDSKAVNYAVSIDDSNNLPETPTIYRPTTGNQVEVPALFLEKNKTTTRNFNFLQVSQPKTFDLLNIIHFEKNSLFFPFDEYYHLITIPVQDYNQIYSAEIIFPASFFIRNEDVKITVPTIEQLFNDNGLSITFAGMLNENEILISYYIEDYKFIAYIPQYAIPNSNLTDEYTKHISDSNKNYLMFEFTYERPVIFKIIFILTIILMVLVIYFSYPLKSKGEKKNYLLTIVSIWAAQEGVSFLQGHRPLDITLFDFTIVLILIPLFLNFNHILLSIQTFIKNKIIRKFKKNQF